MHRIALDTANELGNCDWASINLNVSIHRYMKDLIPRAHQLIAPPVNKRSTEEVVKVRIRNVLLFVGNYIFNESWLEIVLLFNHLFKEMPEPARIKTVVNPNLLYKLSDGFITLRTFHGTQTWKQELTPA